LSLRDAEGGPANVASHELAIPLRDMLPRVQDARKRVPPLHDPNTDDFQSVRPAKLRLAAVNIYVLHLQHRNVNWVLPYAERAANNSAPCASHAPPGYKPAARTGKRPVFRV
jgi:hypothetical protein